MRKQWIDEKGRLLGKVSLIDILILLAVLGLGAGFLYTRTADDVQQIVNANQTFYVTLKGEQVRSFHADAVKEGDIFYKQNERQPLGTVVALRVEQAQDVMLKTDGTAILAPMEDRYSVYVTLACSGSITESGYYANGNVQVSAGNDFKIQSNSLLMSIVVYEVSESPPEV